MGLNCCSFQRDFCHEFTGQAGNNAVQKVDNFSASGYEAEP